MTRVLSLCVLFSLFALLGACVSAGGIGDSDKGSQPSTYAKVLKEPNPILLGHWRRHKPPGLTNPWVFQYYLVKSGDKYAVYYFYDSKKKNMFSGWASFTIDGDSMISGVDGANFFVKGGQVYMSLPGRSEQYPMEKID